MNALSPSPSTSSVIGARARIPLRLAAVLCSFSGLACSASGDGSSRALGAGATSGSGGESGSGVEPGSGGVTNTGGVGANSGAGGIFVGGGAGGGGADECGDKLTAIIRDFTETHPDFERFGVGAALQGIVQQQLGSDQKPIYAHPGPTAQTTGPVEFAQWYNDVVGVNMPIPLSIQFTRLASGGFLYESAAFFPIDNQGLGNGPLQLFLPRNFLFTTEIHTKFTYKGGERFTFRGDDDLWVFVNGRLAIDLGGLHPPLEAALDFDLQAVTLGLVRGSTYAMDIFHAERHTFDSNFRIETSIECFTPVNPPH
jgi:fibro-slime domain-containing protein